MKVSEIHSHVEVAFLEKKLRYTSHLIKQEGREI
ncbi:hypothetical protein JOD29_000154 [Lysinibacillus composti]|nr:hypothetical protein [Lysinibacillus composti]